MQMLHMLHICSLFILEQRVIPGESPVVPTILYSLFVPHILCGPAEDRGLRQSRSDSWFFAAGAPAMTPVSGDPMTYSRVLRAPYWGQNKLRLPIEIELVDDQVLYMWAICRMGLQLFTDRWYNCHVCFSFCPLSKGKRRSSLISEGAGDVVFSRGCQFTAAHFFFSYNAILGSYYGVFRKKKRQREMKRVHLRLWWKKLTVHGLRPFPVL